MIDIYLIRHGQTAGNIAKRHQAEKTKLTETGRAQMQQAARWAKTIAPTHLLSSKHVRALESASLIGIGIDLIPETDDLFIELKRPRHIYGYRHRSLRSLRYLLSWYLGYAGGDGSDQDGESYVVFRERLFAAQQKLQTFPDNARVLLVSHTVFITFFLAHLCDTRPLTPLRALRVFYRLLHLRNGAYTHVRYNPNAAPDECPWQVCAYNIVPHTDT